MYWLLWYHKRSGILVHTIITFPITLIIVNYGQRLDYLSIPLYLNAFNYDGPDPPVKTGNPIIESGFIMLSEGLFKKRGHQIVADVIDSFDVIETHVVVMYSILCLLMFSMICISKRIHSKFNRRGLFKRTDLMWQMIRTVLSQFDYNTPSPSLKMILFVFLMSVSALILLYENLFSTDLVSEEQGFYIDTLSALAESNQTMCVIKGQALTEFFKKPSNTLLYAIYTKFMANRHWSEFNETNMDAVDKSNDLLLGHKCVLMGDMFLLKPVQRFYCNTVLNRNRQPAIKIGKEIIGKSIGVYIMNLDISLELQNRIESRYVNELIIPYLISGFSFAVNTEY